MSFIKFHRIITSTRTLSRNLKTLTNLNLPEQKITHFGFEKIPETLKQEKVNEVFHNVFKDYDIMNDVLSFGIHRIWKDYFVSKLGPVADTKLLDVAGGTGDIVFRFLNYVKEYDLKNCHVTILDINADMLEVGKEKSKVLKHDPELITWQEGNAEHLPFSDNSFDAYTIAFGIRNCTHTDKVLSEAFRVLKPGGRFLCLEFSHLENSIAQWVYDHYSFQVIPVLGQLIAGQWKPYEYLIGSIRQFPNQKCFKNMIEEAGFRQVNYENLNLGIVAIHSGFKL
ncbi:2-methoxy-6-polyprenyl-1,4-benzoquinol methylase, mitochondrial [Euwallacea fornicatus]|uniref:2-methoxy-6-polyprenyl-1,4-benzoquinol methylase, mitochondrial n=1 Tax=Euwallacea fornicatus TaxID=995702 RepID=UPI00338EBAD0